MRYFDALLLAVGGVLVIIGGANDSGGRAFLAILAGLAMVGYGAYVGFSSGRYSFPVVLYLLPLVGIGFLYVSVKS